MKKITESVKSVLFGTEITQSVKNATKIDDLKVNDRTDLIKNAFISTPEPDIVSIPIVEPKNNPYVICDLTSYISQDEENFSFEGINNEDVECLSNVQMDVVYVLDLSEEDSANTNLLPNILKQIKPTLQEAGILNVLALSNSLEKNIFDIDVTTGKAKNNRNLFNKHTFKNAEDMRTNIFPKMNYSLVLSNDLDKWENMRTDYDIELVTNNRQNILNQIKSKRNPNDTRL